MCVRYICLHLPKQQNLTGEIFVNQDGCPSESYSLPASVVCCDNLNKPFVP